MKEQLTEAQALQGDQKIAALSAFNDAARVTFLTPNETFTDLQMEQDAVMKL